VYRYANECCRVRRFGNHTGPHAGVEYERIWLAPPRLRRSMSKLIRQSGTEREGRASRQLPRPADHAAAGPGDRLAVLDPGRRHLPQASLGKSSIKMYDKHGIVLRIETTTNDVSSFKHHERWNTARARRPVPSLRSRSPSTA